MDRKDILAFTEAYKAARGFYPRRVYITSDELAGILGEHILDGRPLSDYLGPGASCEILKFVTPHCGVWIGLSRAAPQIREWDLLSPS